ncbi:hypothetical protein K438DRAFT_1747160 [Mycena galopus ATCC 62051]|nr:hypothetical protein K438DRAFT_1747160 [Mycena galopus ATCC 62051]
MARTVPAAHAMRNPAKRVQLSRRRAGYSGGSKATRVLTAIENKVKKIAFNKDMDEFFADQDVRIREIATAHKKKIPTVKNLVFSRSQYKAARAPSLRNTIIHDLAVKAKVEGKTMILEDYQEELHEEIEAGNLTALEAEISDTEKTRVIDQLKEFRALKRRGVRSTNKAALMDGRQTAIRIGDALMDLYERTGIRGFTLLSRGHADDAALPHAVDSDDALNFFAQVMGMPTVDVVRKFEQWCCTQDSGSREKNDINSVRKEVSKLVAEGLRKIKNNVKVKMDYVNYDVDIREAKGVELAGWPIDVPVVRPSTMNVETARRVRDMLRSGAIHWTPLTRTQQKELAVEHNAQCEALGSGSLKKRAESPPRRRTPATARRHRLRRPPPTRRWLEVVSLPTPLLPFSSNFTTPYDNTMGLGFDMATPYDGTMSIDTDPFATIRATNPNSVLVQPIDWDTFDDLLFPRMLPLTPTPTLTLTVPDFTQAPVETAPSTTALTSVQVQVVTAPGTTVPSGMTSVFSASLSGNAGSSKRRATNKVSDTQPAKKRKTRSDAGVPRAGAENKPRKKRADAGVPRGPRKARSGSN